jgi:hypothetical protein
VLALLFATACSVDRIELGGKTDTGASDDTAPEGTDTGSHTGDSADTDTDTDTALDPGDMDADWDGYTPNEGDCDDTLPHVYPGAPDYCDGLDQDCDGEPIPDGSCSEVGDARAMWTWSFESTEDDWASLATPVGDVDGDGRADLAVMLYTSGGTPYHGGVLFGRELDWLPAVNPAPPPYWDSEFPRWLGASTKEMADVDADGFDDVLVTAGSDDAYIGAVFLFYGSPEGFDYADERVDTIADQRWADTSEHPFYGSMSAGQFDDDGQEDVALVLSIGESDSARLALLRPEHEAGTTDRLADLPFLLWDGPDVVGGADTLTDLDGDGIDELLLASTLDEQGLWETLVVIEGEDFAGGGSMSAVSQYAWVETGSANHFMSWAQEGEEPDIDGDGLADFPFTLNEGEASSVLVVRGIPNGAMNDAVFVEVTSGEPCCMPVWMSAADLDGDGVREVMEGYTPLLSSVLGDGGKMDIGTLYRMKFLFDGSGASLTAVEDMTGDGLPEWVFNEGRWRNTGGSAYDNRNIIIKGFDIPWDDPKKW